MELKDTTEGMKELVNAMAKYCGSRYRAENIKPFTLNLVSHFKALLCACIVCDDCGNKEDLLAELGIDATDFTDLLDKQQERERLWN